MNFFQGFFYRPGDAGTQDFFKKYGMSFFSWEYFLIISLSIISIITLLIFLYKRKWNIFTQMKIFAIVLSILEISKILFFTINRQNIALESWLPLFYCSLFIYALYFAGYGKGFIKQMGISAIFMLTVAGLCGIFANDIFSGVGWPLFNFYTLYSISFHTLMVYFGYGILITKNFYPTLKSFIAGILFVTIFFVLALIINLCCHTNLMSMMPYRIQTMLLYKIGSIFGDNLTPLVMYIIYTLGVFAVAMLPFYILWLIRLIKGKYKKDKNIKNENS